MLRFHVRITTFGHKRVSGDLGTSMPCGGLMLGRIHAAQIRKQVHDDCKRENLAARGDGMNSEEYGSGILAIDVRCGVKRMLHVR